MADLTEEIDAWSTAVPFFDGEGVTDAMWSNSQRLFDMAHALSMWMREVNTVPFAYWDISGGVNTLRSMGYAASQQRNGCEPWQAFLTVAHLGRVMSAPEGQLDRAISVAMGCAYRCLQDRIGQVGYRPCDIRPSVVVQVAELDHMRTRFLQNCLTSVVERASCSYSMMWEVHDVLTHALGAIEQGRHGGYNVTDLRTVLDTVDGYLADTDARVVTVVQGLHHRLGERSLLKGLEKDLVSKIVEFVKER
jgi:hypothetical protein